jgi:hypothetical protein
MAGLRFIELDFVDGTSVRYSFPVQAANVAAKQVKLESLFKDRFLILQGEGKLSVFPLENIKAVHLSGEDDEFGGVRLPAHTLRGVQVV